MSRETEELRTQVSESAKLGEYSNFVKIQHSAIDFMLDFAKILPEENMIHVHTRLFMSPIHAKLFAKAMIENIEKYEQKFGTIDLKFEKGTPIPGVVSKETH
ncbi:MAG TPA: DUF3467 domain-containing protein [bacterium]|nr:DUF3467 domain-containing protein [bacterium]